MMLHLAMSSHEPLPLGTFMLAVEYLMKNKSFYAENQPINIPEFPSPQGSNTTYLRRLISRSGGLLEVYTVSRSDREGTSDQALQQTLPEVLEGFEADLPLLPRATTQAVQFLHATAKEYVQEHQRSFLMYRIEKALTGLNGYDLLFLCCAPCDPWVAPIKRHMFYYANKAEVRCNSLIEADNEFGGACTRGRGTILLQMVKDAATRYEEDACGLCWLLRQQEGFLCSILGDLIAADRSRTYNALALAVLASASHVVEYLLSEKSRIIKNNFRRSNMCLLQIAVAGPDLVPIENQNRSEVIKILVLSGYPVDRCFGLCTKGVEGEKPLTTIEPEERCEWTPLKVLLTGNIESEYDADTRLAITDSLLNEGADPNFAVESIDPTIGLWLPLVYCVQHENAHFVRLLLQHGGDASRRDPQGLKPIHYALIRQDKAIWEALTEQDGCARLRPPRLRPEKQPEDVPAAELAATHTMLMGSIGHPMISAFCARGPLSPSVVNSIKHASAVNQATGLADLGSRGYLDSR